MHVQNKMERGGFKFWYIAALSKWAEISGLLKRMASKFGGAKHVVVGIDNWNNETHETYENWIVFNFFALERHYMLCSTQI